MIERERYVLAPRGWVAAVLAVSAIGTNNKRVLILACCSCCLLPKEKRENGSYVES